MTSFQNIKNHIVYQHFFTNIDLTILIKHQFILKSNKLKFFETSEYKLICYSSVKISHESEEF